MFRVMVMSMLFLSVSVCLAQYDSGASVDKNPSDFAWPDGKRMALSLSFDDARESQLDVGLPILDKHDVKATFYISINRFEARLDDWKAAQAKGHEMGNHSLVHPCTGNFTWARQKALEDYTLKQMRQELQEANRMIAELTGLKPISFAYPCGQTFAGRGKKLKSYVPLVAEMFLSGRGWLDEGPNDPAFCDLAQLLAMEFDGKTFDQILELIANAQERGGWLILAGHDIGVEPDRQTTLTKTLDLLCEYAKNPENGVWIDTVGNVAQYVAMQQRL